MDGNAIKKVLQEYLKRPETDYAIMIDGEWGCGKTYYVCNVLKEAIVKTACPKEVVNTKPNDTQKAEKYHFIYYSLYGASSSEEISIGIKKQIVIHSTDEKEKTKKKKDKATTFVEMVVGVVADRFNVDSKRLFNLYDLIDVPKNVVLIFDDLERSKMPLVELLGIINKYAVIDKRKVIVISNELKLEKDFCDFKEKTIRFTLNYSPTQEELLRNIIESKKEIADGYKQFINNNLHLILEIFRKGDCKNLRTFIFILDIFEKIYIITRKQQFAEDFLKGFLIFTCVYSIEYKNNSPKDKLDWLSDFLTLYGITTIFSISENVENNKKDDNNDSFIKHITRYGYDCLVDIIGSNSIANFIQFGDLDEAAIKEEIKREEDKFIESRKTEYGRTLNKMMDWRLVDDNEINDVLSNVERFLREDKYTASEISTLYARYLTLKSNNIKCIDIDSSVFFEAVDRLQNKWTPVIYHDGTVSLFEWRERGYPYDKQYKSLYDYILKIDNIVKHKYGTKRSVELLNKIKENNLDSLKQYLRTMDSKQWFIQDPDELWLALQESNTSIQQYVIGELKNATDKNDYQNYEISFIDGICQHFEPLFTGENIDFGLLKYKDLATRFNKIRQMKTERDGRTTSPTTKSL